MSTYLLAWRRSTPKGTPKEVVNLEHLTQAELERELDHVLPQACWVYIETEGTKAAGAGGRVA